MVLNCEKRKRSKAERKDIEETFSKSHMFFLCRLFYTNVWSVFVYGIKINPPLYPFPHLQPGRGTWRYLPVISQPSVPWGHFLPIAGRLMYCGTPCIRSPSAFQQSKELNDNLKNLSRWWGEEPLTNQITLSCSLAVVLMQHPNCRIFPTSPPPRTATEEVIERGVIGVGGVQPPYRVNALMLHAWTTVHAHCSVWTLNTFMPMPPRLHVGVDEAVLDFS
jgi:hypothetical protein